MRPNMPKNASRFSTEKQIIEDLKLDNMAYNTSLYNSKIDVPGYTPIKGKSGEVLDKYFRLNGGTELNARGVQLKNYYGITDPYQEINEDMWNYARKNFVKDNGIDVNMQDMFRSVNDPKEFLKWLNPRIVATVPAAYGLQTINNKQSN